MENKIISCDCDFIHSHLVDNAKKQMLDESTMCELSEFFKVFGDTTRIKILWALDINEMCVCDIAYLLNMTKSAISHQLKYLRNANLVKYRKEGKVTFYSLKDNHVKDIIEIGFEHISEGENL